jgi:hypothetical protein
MDEPQLQPRGRKRPQSGDPNVSNDASSTLGMILVCVFLFIHSAFWVVILKVFGVLDVPMQEQVRVPLGDMSNQVEVRPNAG